MEQQDRLWIATVPPEPEAEKGVRTVHTFGEIVLQTQSAKAAAGELAVEDEPDGIIRTARTIHDQECSQSIWKGGQQTGEEPKGPSLGRRPQMLRCLPSNRRLPQLQPNPSPNTIRMT
jgi:hypothetical protein